MQPGKLNTTIRQDTAQRHKHKYENPNPIHQWTLGRFFDTVAGILRAMGARNVLEFGCGEGLFLDQLKRRGVKFDRFVGVDLREGAIADAAKLHPEYEFHVADILQWDPGDQPFDLVIASQVMEHIPEPDPIMRRLMALTQGEVLFTVPREPWFRLLNLARGRDLARLGNHPEHVNLWSSGAFVNYVRRFGEVTDARTVTPFTIVLAQPQSHLTQDASR